MEKGDWVVLPLKSQAAVYIGEIVGEDIPRSHFGQDLLHSFGAFMTIFRIQRNNAEDRLKKMQAKAWAAESMADLIGAKSSAIATDSDLIEPQVTDLEEQGQDQIASLIEARFKGHNLTRLVEAILQAQVTRHGAARKARTVARIFWPGMAPWDLGSSVSALR